MGEVGGVAYATSIQAQFMKIKRHDIIQYFKKHLEDSKLFICDENKSRVNHKITKKSVIIACEAIITVLKLLKLHVCTSITIKPEKEGTTKDNFVSDHDQNKGFPS